VVAVDAVEGCPQVVETSSDLGGRLSGVECLRYSGGGVCDLGGGLGDGGGGVGILVDLDLDLRRSLGRERWSEKRRLTLILNVVVLQVGRLEEAWIGGGVVVEQNGGSLG
jgi:hypothetical protein